ncbi:MAG: hypothetical protein CMO01_25740 [Thalassobius sp.]|nr:hypothetical protein [Thalassovita sp.]
MLNKTIKLSQFLIIVLTLYSCNQTSIKTELKQANNTNAVLIADFDQLEEKDIKLSEIVDFEKLILLENSENALLNKPSAFAYSDNYLLVTDNLNKPAKLFSTDGKFLKNLGTVGRGPAEYGSVYSPIIDQNNKQFWLLVGGNYSHLKDGWFYIYDENGDFLKELEMPFLKHEKRNINNALLLKNQIIVAGNTSSEYLLAYANTDGQNVTEFPNRFPTDYFTYLVNISHVIPTDGENQLLCHLGETDTVFSINLKDTTISPKIIIKNEKHKFNADKIKQARKNRNFAEIVKASSGGYSIELKGETDKYFLFFVRVAGKQTEYKEIFVDKASGKCFTGKIINDLLNDAPIDNLDYLYQNDYLFLHFPAYKFSSLMSEKDNIHPEITAKINSLSEPLTDEDNDVILVCKLKKGR